MQMKYSDYDRFKIFLNSLKGGHVEKIEEKFKPDFLDIHEAELEFVDPVYVKGEAYFADENLIIHLEISTEARLPCTICNEPVKLPIKLQNFYYSEPIGDVKNGIFSMRDAIREGVLVEVPSFAECNNGTCPKRAEFEKYLRKPTASQELDDHYRPFDGLKFE